MMCSIMKRRIITIFIVAIVCWISTAVDAFGSFSESTLHRLAMASSLSYLSIEKIKQSPYYNECKLEPITQVVDPTSESGATIFRVIDNSNNDNNREHQQLVVACRGSANPKNFGTNLKFNLVPATRLSQNYIPENAQVHEGFQSAAVGLWKELAQPLMKEIEKTSSSSSVVFTGHSLGGATSLLTAVHYQASISGVRGSLPDVITFGGPKLCNSELARHIRNESLSQCNILHLVHSSDPVLANNQKLWNDLGFENVGIELQCDPNKPVVYYREDETPKKGIAWNIVDHCKYMVRYVCVLLYGCYCCCFIKYLTLLTYNVRVYSLVQGYNTNGFVLT